MEPRSLLEENPTDVERALLRAGRTDGPGPDATAHLLAVMQALPPAPTVAGGPMASGRGDLGPALPVKPVELARWAKLGLLAVAAGGVATGTLFLARTNGNTPVSEPAMQEIVPVAAPDEDPAPVQATAPVEAREGVTAALEEEQRLAAGESRARRRRASLPLRPREASDTSLDRSLGNETRALDRAREALDEHRPSEAVRLLDEYQRSFPQGRLRPESMVLRLAALVQAGKRGAAESMARQLLADEAYQTYAPRIRTLLGEARP